MDTYFAGSATLLAQQKAVRGTSESSKACCFGHIVCLKTEPSISGISRFRAEPTSTHNPEKDTKLRHFFFSCDFHGLIRLLPWLCRFLNALTVHHAEHVSTWGPSPRPPLGESLSPICFELWVRSQTGFRGTLTTEPLDFLEPE